MDKTIGVDSCRLGLCMKCGTPWPRHSVPGCTGTYPRIMEHRQRVEAVAEDPIPPLQTPRLALVESGP